MRRDTYETIATAHWFKGLRVGFVFGLMVGGMGGLVAVAIALVLRG